MKLTSALCLLTWAAMAVVAPASASPLAQRVAEAYGVRHFDQIDAIRYTFNIEKGDVHVARSWVWEPKARRVTYHGKGAAGDTITYSYEQSKVDTTQADMKFVDARFVNDQYWFLYPFHLTWDTMATITEAEADSLPDHSGVARHLTVTYPKDGGYSPGDVYELFLGADDRITHWIFRPGGSTEQRLVFTWGGNRQVGPITVATEHSSPDGAFKLYFSDVAVRLKGHQDWITQ